MGVLMKYISRILLVLLSALTVVSFQNCGQSGEIALQSQSDLSKLNTNAVVSDGTEIVDPDLVNELPPVDSSVPNTDATVPSSPEVMPPSTSEPVTSPVVGSPTDPSVGTMPVDGSVPSSGSTTPSSGSTAPSDGSVSMPNAGVDPSTGSISSPVVDDPQVSHGSIRHDDKEDSDVDLSQEAPEMDVDEGDGTIKSGKKVSCANLNRLVMSTNLFVKATKLTSLKNSNGALKISNEDSVSIDKHRGLLLLTNINHILKLNNIRSMLLLADGNDIGVVSDVRGLSLMSADQVNSIHKFRGILCLDSANTESISNFRGILEINGNVKKISNFRGILKVKGNIEKLENFRGLLKVDGDILSQSDVKVKLK